MFVSHRLGSDKWPAEIYTAMTEGRILIDYNGASEQIAKVQADRGMIDVKSGDWILLYRNGALNVVSDERYRAMVDGPVIVE